MEDILEWIAHFQHATHTFTNGCCYWFAYLLQAEFNATIWYAPIQGHFVGKIHEQFYDVNGVFTPCTEDATRMIMWDTLQQTDPLWAQRIARDCIHFKERDEK